MPDEPDPRSGKFSLADAMLLIAATAAALGWARTPLERRISFIADGRIIDAVRPSTLIGAAFALTWSVATIGIRLRRARLPGSRLRSEPGFIACLAAAVGSLAKLTALLTWGTVLRFRFEQWYVPSILGQLIEPAAMAVIGAWLALAIAGAWRPERTWVDRLGIAIGIFWVALYVFAWAALCLE